MTDRKINIAVCGLGWWGSKILRNCKTNHGVGTLIACDPDNGKREAMTKEHGVESFPSLQDALKRHKLDAAFIITPPETHYEIVKYALSNNLHTVVAKPPTLTFQETDEIATLAAKQGLILMTDATFCYSPPATKIKDLLDSGAIGPVRHIQSIRYGDNLRVQGLQRLEYAMRDTGTNVIQDLIMHDLALITYLLGEGFSVNFVSQSDTLFKGISDTAHIALRKPDVNVDISISWIMPERTRKLTICGEKGLLVWDDLSESQRLWSLDITGENKTVYQLENTEPLQNMIYHFLNCIKSGNEPATGPDLMKTAMRMFNKIQELTNE